MSFIKNKENIERQIHKKKPQNFRPKPILTIQNRLIHSDLRNLQRKQIFFKERTTN